MKLLESILDEIKKFLSGKTIDALLPPIIYVIANNFLELKISVFLALTIAVLSVIFRLIKKENIIYSLGGIGGVLLASAFALFSNNAANYFLPKIIGSIFLFLILLISLLIGKPAAAILSHLSRGWSFSWFMRKDIRPAYQEVTIAWGVLVFIRLALQLYLYQRGNLNELAWSSILLGFPASFTVLILTLIYGVWRLKKLGGPGIEEYEEGKNPPWEGQKKGF